MFGHDSLPSRVYSYGAKVPLENLERVESQMRLAHRYRNKLVELELTRRQKVDEVLKTLSPLLEKVEAEIADTEKKLESARTSIRRVNAEVRKKTRPPEVVAAISECRERLRELRLKRKTLRAELFDSSAYRSCQDELEAWVKQEVKAARKGSELYWGTYLLVEQSLAGIRRGTPPKFLRWDGDGHLALQLQCGLSVEDAFKGNDTRLRIDPVPENVWDPGMRRHRKTKVWIRVGTDVENNPVWTVVPFVMHRPIPIDTTIKWVHLIRRRIGTHCEWRVQFVLSRQAGWAKGDLAQDGVVAIDVGWRLRPDRGLRVAYWVGSDGQEGELVLPPDWLSEMRKTEDIRSIRDCNFNAAKLRLQGWLRDKTLPEWIREKVSTLGHWKSCARLAALSISWRSARFEYDDDGFGPLDLWRKRDRHLYEYEANLRDQLQRRREHIYRNFAAQMRRKYRTAVIENLDLRDFHVLPEPEEKSNDGAIKEHVRDACQSVFVTALKHSMRETIEAPAANTTRKCFACGTMQDWDRKILTHICSACGTMYDQDRNACLNLQQWFVERGRVVRV